MFKILKENFAYKFDADSAILTFSVEVRIIRNPDIFGPFDRPKIDAPNSGIVKKTLFLKHFFMSFTDLHDCKLLLV